MKKASLRVTLSADQIETIEHALSILESDYDDENQSYEYDALKQIQKVRNTFINAAARKAQKAKGE